MSKWKTLNIVAGITSLATIFLVIIKCLPFTYGTNFMFSATPGLAFFDILGNISFGSNTDFYFCALIIAIAVIIIAPIVFFAKRKIGTIMVTTVYAIVFIRYVVNFVIVVFVKQHYAAVSGHFADILLYLIILVIYALGTISIFKLKNQRI